MGIKLPSNSSLKKKIFGIVFAALCLCVALIAGCSSIDQATPTTVSASIIYTQAAQTLAPIQTALVATQPSATVVSTDIPLLFETPAPLPTATIAPAAILPTARQASQSTSGTFRYHMINVGQGDSALIQSPDGWNILIDGGEANSGASLYLQSLGISHLNLVIATHPHSDHIGGLVQILQTFQVDKVITNGESYTTTTYNNFLNAIISRKIPYTEVKRGDTISAGILSFQVLNPTGTGFDPNPNENSIVLKFTFGKTTFLSMGDAGKVIEPGLLASGISLKADILKVSHH